jgi:hypothetical protein
MIPAPPAIAARYRYETANGETRWTHDRIVAFDDEGAPLVLGERELERADETGIAPVLAPVPAPW